MSPRVSPVRRHCHCLSPADIMADKEGVTLSLEEEEEEDADVALAYKTPEKKSLREIQELDPGDESLRKYKQALLGAIPATVGKAGGCLLALGTPAPRLGAAASAGTGSSGIPSTRGVSPAPAGCPQQGGGIPSREGASRLASPVGAASAPPPARRPRHPPADTVTAARGPRLPWLRDHRRSFHRNGYKGPGNSLG